MRLCVCLIVWDTETSTKRRPRPELGCRATDEKSHVLAVWPLVFPHFVQAKVFKVFKKKIHLFAETLFSHHWGYKDRVSGVAKVSWNNTKIIKSGNSCSCYFQLVLQCMIWQTASQIEGRRGTVPVCQAKRCQTPKLIRIKELPYCNSSLKFIHITILGFDFNIWDLGLWRR